MAMNTSLVQNQLLNWGFNMEYEFVVEFNRKYPDSLDEVIKTISALYSSPNYGLRVKINGNCNQKEFLQYEFAQLMCDGTYPIDVILPLIKYNMASLPIAKRSQQDEMWQDATTHQTIKVTFDSHGISIRPKYILLG